MINFNKEGSFNSKEYQAYMEAYPDEEDTEDVIIDDKIENH